uniref:Protein, containing FMN red domain n=1 Tax=Rhipicephalus zambeziensis TaxID=60191 RepID=A0A224YNQ1_9ACAR
MASQPLKLVLFVGSCRTERIAERLKRYVTAQLQKRGHQVSVIDPEEEPNLLAVRKPLHFHGPDEAPPAWLSLLHDKVKEAHGYLVLCPEYNRCIAPALGSAMDHFPPDSYRHKPCAIVAYSIGTGAGLAAAMQLRSFLGELGMVTVPFISLNPKVQLLVAEDGTASDDGFSRRMAKLLAELEWYGAALGNHMEACGPPGQ